MVTTERCEAQVDNVFLHAAPHVSFMMVMMIWRYEVMMKRTEDNDSAESIAHDLYAVCVTT